MVLSESSQAQKAQVVWFHCYGASSLDKCVQPESKAVVTGRWGGAPQVAQQGSICSGDTGDSGLVPGWGRSPGEGNGNPLQYSCLKNPMDGGAWRATVPMYGRTRRLCKTGILIFKSTIQKLTGSKFQNRSSNLKKPGSDPLMHLGSP